MQKERVTNARNPRSSVLIWFLITTAGVFACHAGGLPSAKWKTRATWSIQIHLCVNRFEGLLSSYFLVKTNKNLRVSQDVFFLTLTLGAGCLNSSWEQRLFHNIIMNLVCFLQVERSRVSHVYIYIYWLLITLCQCIYIYIWVYNLQRIKWLIQRNLGLNGTQVPTARSFASKCPQPELLIEGSALLEELLVILAADEDLFHCILGMPAASVEMCWHVQASTIDYL